MIRLDVIGREAKLVEGDRASDWLTESDLRQIVRAIGGSVWPEGQARGWEGFHFHGDVAALDLLCDVSLHLARRLRADPRPAPEHRDRGGFT